MTDNYIYVTQVHKTPNNRMDDVYVATTLSEAQQQFQSYIERRCEEFEEGEVTVKKLDSPKVVDEDDFEAHGEFLLEVPSVGLQYQGETYTVYVGG